MGKADIQKGYRYVIQGLVNPQYLKVLVKIKVVTRINLKDELVVDAALVPGVHVDAEETRKQKRQKETRIDEQETVKVWNLGWHLVREGCLEGLEHEWHHQSKVQSNPSRH